MSFVEEEVDKEKAEFSGESSNEESKVSTENKSENQNNIRENNNLDKKKPEDKKTTISQGTGSDVKLDSTERDGVGVLPEEDRKRFKLTTENDKSRMEKSLHDAYSRKNDYIQSGDTSKLEGVNRKIEYYEKVLDRPSTLVVKSNDFNKKIETIKSKPTNTKTKTKIIVATKTIEKNVPVDNIIPVGGQA